MSSSRKPPKKSGLGIINLPGVRVSAPCFLFFVVLAPLTFCTCAGSGRAGASPDANLLAGNNSFVTLPGPGGLPVLGVSARLSSRGAEIEAAREDAARKVSMYNYVWASVVSVQNIGSGYLDYYVDSNTQVVYDENLERYLDKLSFDPDRDVMRNSDGSVFIKFAYPAAFPGIVSYSFARNQDGSPEWKSRPPREISGFLAGVGFSARLERLGDTFRKSYESAAASIVSGASNSVVARDTQVGSQGDSNIRSRSSGGIYNFTVLETWIDPKSRAVWTLAIARSAN